MEGTSSAELEGFIWWLKSVNVFIRAAMGCGKGWWGFCLCSRKGLLGCTEDFWKFGAVFASGGRGDMKQRGLVWW